MPFIPHRWLGFNPGAAPCILGLLRGQRATAKDPVSPNRYACVTPDYARLRRVTLKKNSLSPQHPAEKPRATLIARPPNRCTVLQCVAACRTVLRQKISVPPSRNTSGPSPNPVSISANQPQVRPKVALGCTYLHLPALFRPQKIFPPIAKSATGRGHPKP